ncbi:hypothetical protein SAMN05192551_11245 [Tindallia magadiensis]|uniref:Uncharacterized protein n=1 Tax=Tindallia magadiensis TaxID=69895 RepID=A0A1I3HCC2_9FIRM|nr:hypothetical protein [Tindallia magadiensis]SFI33200.1 hypothetical protein SAMN05192551_11245 [Tindallia magadiensis]
MIRENTDLKTIQKQLEELPKETVIGEFAGRDSVAAIMEALKSPEINHVLPVVTFAPTEYGSEKELEINHQRMVARVQKLYGEKKKIYPLIYDSSLPLWRILNGRNLMSLQQEYGFYTPCIGCHTYFHVARVPLAKALGKKIIAGERESHGGKIKVNQLKVCLDSYQNILEALGVELLLPIRNMEKDELIEDLIGWPWAAEEEQPVCLFSGNYRNHEGKAIYDLEKIHHFLKNYLEPLAITLGKHYEQQPGIKEKELERIYTNWEVQRQR